MESEMFAILILTTMEFRISKTIAFTSIILIKLILTRENQIVSAMLAVR